MDDRPLAVGDWVRHPEFGDGLILEAKGAGDSASVLVSFPDNTRRRLMLKFARLSRLEPSEASPPPPGGEPKPARARAPRKRAGGS